MKSAHKMLANALEKIATDLASSDDYDLKAYVVLQEAARYLREPVEDTPPKMRLVCLSRDRYPHGEYEGTERQYILQWQEPGGPWHTLPAVDFMRISEVERQEISRTLRKV